MNRPQVCVGAVTVDDGALLLVRRGRGPAQGDWSVPGGRVEPGETLAEAVVRELHEETGVEGVCGPLLGVVERMHGDEHYVILDYGAHVLERQEPTAGDDAAEARWVPIEEVGELRLVEGLAEFLFDHGVIPTIL